MKVLRIDDIEGLPVLGTLVWQPVRRPLGITAFGINAYTAGEGGLVVEEDASALAAVLIVAAASPDPPPAAAYVLSAPGVRGRATMSRFSRVTLELASRAIPAVGFRGSAPGFSPTDNEAAMRRWSEDPLTAREFRVDLVYGLVNLMDDALAVAPYFIAPALVLYGGEDRIVPASPVRRLLDALPDGAPQRLAFYPQGHHLLLRDSGRAKVAQDILAWMEAPDAPLPSGADAAGRRWLADARDR
jgi:alpha-beta hydrolase superfamily lysophospholipase